MEHHLDFTNAIAIPYFNFAVFLIAFVVFFRKPLIKMAQSKRDTYLKASKEAAASLQKAHATFDEVKTRFQSLDLELQSFKKQSEQAAKTEAQRIVEETERFARQIKEETSRLATDTIERARLELRHEVVEAAKKLAAHKIEKDLDAAAKDKILKSRISEASTMSVQ